MTVHEAETDAEILTPRHAGILVTTAALLALLFGGAAWSSPETAAPKKPPAVEITTDQITIGTEHLVLPAESSAVVKALGKPSRTLPPQSQNELVVWDTLGVLGYRSTETGKIHILTFYLSTVPDRDEAPHQPFAGPIHIGTVVLDARSTLDEAGKGLLQQGAQHKSRLAFGVWNLRFGHFVVSFEQIKAETLQTVSVDIPSP
jgi:hypothetical protein